MPNYRTHTVDSVWLPDVSNFKDFAGSAKFGDRIDRVCISGSYGYGFTCLVAIGLTLFVVTTFLT
ncbi:TPA: hypothetical protein ACVO5S_001893 [Legionella pneumophila]